MAGVLIVANGAWPKSFKIDEVFAEYEHVLALDGAANRMVDAGIVPTAIIGDLDSIDNTTLEHCKANGSLVIHTPNQE
jgi:thiamine pyrophosphokinase